MAAIEQLIREAIEQLRLKLLDLTNRNRLLNFKFTDTSKKYVRIVDEIPGHLYDRLTSDKTSSAKLYFASLPEPPLESIESDDTSHPRRRSTAGAGAKAAGERAVANDPEPAPHTGPARFNLEQWARDNGIDPAYDLPEKSTVDFVDKHLDNRIQTLLLPEPLAKKMARIREDARLAEQEQGTSTLYAAFGFLEWYEDARSKEARYAPLFLLPVQLNREIKGQQYRYFIECGEGADPTINISLRERLRRDFDFALPALEENQGAEDYLAAVSKAIESMVRWKVRRFVVIGHFSFARLAMYEDLDPEKWAASPLETQSLICDLLAGAETAAADSYAEDFETESEAVEKLVPALVLDADSSQYSAIVDAMQGRSFALKGPPGTGKSQTITNLIAAAIAANKRVLFVAEKLAALEVVSKRLTEAGLGPFVLELHSTKVQKKKVAESFAERLEIRKPSVSTILPSGSEQLADLKEVRGLLHRYASILNSPVGCSNLTLHDILWHEQRCRSELSERAHVLSSSTLDGNQTQKTQSQMVAALESLRTLTSGVAVACASAGSMPNHPLYSLPALSTDRREQEQTRQTLKALEATVQGLQGLAERLKSRLRIASGPTLGALSQFAQRLLAIPVPDAVSTALLGFIRAADDAERAAQVIDRAQAARTQLDHLNSVLEEVYDGMAAATPLAAEAERLRDLAQRLAWGDPRLDAAGDKLQHQEADLARMRTLLGLLDRWAIQLGLVRPLRIVTVGSLVAALDLLHRTPVPCLRQRHQQLFRPSVRVHITAAKTTCQQLKREEQALQKHARISFQENPQELIAAAHVIGHAGPWTRLFSAAYRQAKQVYQTLSRDPWDRLTASARLQDWAAAIERRQVFETNAALQEEIGPAFAGMQTPFDELTGTVDFWDAVRTTGWPSLAEEKGKIPWGLLTAAGAQLEEARSSFSAEDLRLLKALSGWKTDSDMCAVDDVLTHRSEQLAQARNALKTLTRIPWRTPVSIEGAISHCQTWVRLAAIIQELSQSPLRELVLPNARLPESAELARLRATAAWAPAVFRSQLPPEAIQLLLSPQSLEAMRALRHYATAMTGAADKVRALIPELQRQASLALEDWTAGASLDAVDLTLLQQRAATAAGAPPDCYADWAALCEARRELTAAGAGALATAVIRGELEAQHAEQCYHRLYYRSLIQAVNEQHPDSRSWTGNKLHHARTRLGELDRAHIKYSTKELIQTLAAREVPIGVSRGAKKDLTERSLIENEVGKQGRHIPIRALLARAFHAAQALKPCFMMSPASVSQFLSQVPSAFDLIVIDEASQMRPEDALATLARGKQIVVVGDPMQLPPTTFFDAVQDDAADESDDDLAIDTESILDLALSKLRPARDLRWHYRSRHEALIAFSNREFYRDRLIVFPSPIAKTTRLGVQYVFVANGCYKASLNPTEAAEIVKTVAGLIHQDPTRSIGVVAANQPQRDLLSDEFDRLFAQNDALEAYRAHWNGTLEPFFVNNLENVQGHERDIIVISTVYGPETPGGPVFQRFGPINSKMGHRRLNVLFTRAKELVVLVTSLKSEDIKALPTSPPGVVALKNYLEFARSGRLDSGTHTARSPESPFEAEVAELLTQLGHRVQAQVGVAGFFIDMAVRHPARHDHYVLGIECDGATYHSAKSARDRDRLRQEILERLGWRLHRIWSTDWYHGRDREVARLQQAVNAAIDGNDLSAS